MKKRKTVRELYAEYIEEGRLSKKEFEEMKQAREKLKTKIAKLQKQIAFENRNLEMLNAIFLQHIGR